MGGLLPKQQRGSHVPWTENDTANGGQMTIYGSQESEPKNPPPNYPQGRTERQWVSCHLEAAEGQSPFSVQRLDTGKLSAGGTHIHRGRGTRPGPSVPASQGRDGNTRLELLQPHGALSQSGRLRPGQFLRTDLAPRLRTGGCRNILCPFEGNKS